VIDLQSVDSLSAEQLREAVRSLHGEVRFKQSVIDKLTHENAALKRLKFAASSEAYSAEQKSLLEETLDADLAAVAAEIETLQPSTSNGDKRQPRREKLPAELPRREIRHEPEDTTCGCGTPMQRIGEDVAEKLDYQPGVFTVERHIRGKWVCACCEKLVQAPVAPHVIDKGLPTTGLLAQVLVAKYLDHLPLYRQEAIFARHGIEIGRTTLAEWTGVIGLRLQPLVDALRTRLLQSPVLHADETPVAQLDPGRGQTKRTYLFAYRSTGKAPIVVFDHCPSRAGRHAEAFLGTWNGALMVDDYAGYKALFEKGGITELACWAHARRGFFDAHAASGHPLAQEAVNRIAELYAIEAKLRDLNDEDRGAERRRHIGPWLAAFKTWLDAAHANALGNSGVRKAIDYALRRWSALARVLDDGRYPIDNNPIENAIRPIAVGRKNWLFAGSETAARRAAAIMSLIATAKANGIEPHAWLTDVLTRLPTTRERDIETLLPLA
jgi:transposase